MRAFFAAVRFFTVLPVPASWCCGEGVLAHAVVHLPLLGLVLGALALGLDCALQRLFPPVLAAAFLVLALVAISGALHLDGLADTADGFLSARPRERILEIMRDSRIGTMGVAAVFGVLTLKVAALASMSGEDRWQALLLMPLAGRCAIVWLMAFLPYARAEGLVSVLGRVGWRHAAWAASLLFLVGWSAAGTRGVVAVDACLACAVLFGAWCRAKIGGYTGDTLGASCELAELAVALVLVSGGA